MCWALQRDEFVMDLTPQGTDTSCESGRCQWDHRTDGFRERCCRSDDSAPGGRYFASQPRHVLDKIQPSLNLVKSRNFREKQNIVRVYPNGTINNNAGQNGIGCVYPVPCLVGSCGCDFFSRMTFLPRFSAWVEHGREGGWV